MTSRLFVQVANAVCYNTNLWIIITNSFVQSKKMRVGSFESALYCKALSNWILSRMVELARCIFHWNVDAHHFPVDVLLIVSVRWCFWLAGKEERHHSVWQSFSYFMHYYTIYEVPYLSVLHTTLFWDSSVYDLGPTLHSELQSSLCSTGTTVCWSKPKSSWLSW